MMKREETPSLMEEPAVKEIAEEHSAHPVQVRLTAVGQCWTFHNGGIRGWRRFAIRTPSMAHLFACALLMHL
jgi:hypothetical protein